eukprot:CAMPEP_0171453132 /NCGR_PEP_ID=MMETSP0945-20130129/963_1 /TAXON_ID=109269 /ORGANISM="Vaucheria litorea, Strain CCMP2940" /LENGTH=181 /DNA_ID=CAMNT_0011977939 /DNA_START=138 /DNA_END=683 /DNA_ORIENTATION=-
MEHSNRPNAKEASESSDKSRVAQVGEIFQWIQSHPVLATVIWVFGKVYEGTRPLIEDEKKSPPSPFQSTHGSSKRLSWNDEHGGNLAHYYNDENEADDTSNKDSPKKYRTEPEGIHLRTNNQKDSLYAESSNPQSLPNCMISTNTVSPQWGWYVTLTPPQDFFSNNHNSSMDSSHQDSNNF